MPLYPQGITRDLILTVSGKTASLSEQCYIYRGDRGITLNISIQQYKYKFNKKTVSNVISSDTSIAYARALVHKPWLVKKLDEEPETPDHGHQYDENGNYTGNYATTGGCFEIPIVRILNDTIEIPITADWVDELTEIGTYRLQIQLYGHRAEDHRITIPPVEFYVEEPMCDLPEDFSELDQTGFAAADYVVLRQNGEAYSANFAGGNYNKISWTTGEIITANRLNKIEDAMDFTITKLATVPTMSEIDEKLALKADKDHDHVNSYNNMQYSTLQQTFTAVENHVKYTEGQLRLYTNSKASEAESNAKKYTDGEIVKAKSYTDQEVGKALDSAKSYTDQEVGKALKSAKDYADQAETDAISASKKYTDEEIEKIDAKVTTNTTNIANNTTNIATNAANILNNTTDISTLRTNINSLGNHVDEVEISLTGKINDAKTELNNSINTVQTNLDTAKTELNNSINTVQSNLDTAKIELNNSINTVQTNLDTAKTELKNYTDAEIKELSDSLSTVATSGSYNDLLDKPFIPSKTSELENDGNGENEGEVFLSSITCTHVEFVEKYPTEEEKRDGYLYILIEEL